MERFILKHKMKKLIQVLGGLGICFTLIIGVIGFVMSSKITESANYIYSYKRYSKLVHEIHNNFLTVKNSELINLASGDTAKFKEDLQKADEVIRANLDEYNSTEYEEEEEENYIKNITSAYKGYYNIIIDLVNQYEKGQEISPKADTEIEKYENILEENVNGVTEYLDYWATHDMDAINLDNKKTKIEYGLIIAVSIAIFSLMAANIIKVFSRESKIINDSLKEISEGNLVVELECNNNTEFDDMKSSINKTVENFESIIKGIKEKTSDIDEKAENLSTVSSDLSAAVQNAHLAIENITNSTGEQANDLSDVNSILNKFSKSISEFIESITFLDSNANVITNKANESSYKMDELAAAFRHVDELIKSFTHKITDLNKTVGEISGITNFINDIAEQTNLLALNAAIESARVGEAGKGFAVVADQIRTLAEQSKESANNITKLINDVSKGTNEIAKDGDTVNEKLNSSMFIINDSLRSFNEIIEAIEDVAEKIGHLSSASKVINEEKDAIHKKVEKSSDIAAEIVASSEEVLSSISEVNSSSKNVQDTSINLSGVTNVLEKEIQIFKTK